VNRPSWRWSFVLTQAAAIAVVGAQIRAHVVPAVQRDGAFATYYTAASLVVDAPQWLPSIYDNGWFNRQIHATGFPHINDIYNVNPPTMGVMLAPLALLPVAVARLVWVGLNLGALVGGVALLCRGLGLTRGWILPLVALAALTEPVRHHFARNQAYLLLFAGLCAFIRSWLSSRTDRAGVALGLMLGFKTAGAWILLLGMLRRDWRLVGAAVVTGAGLILLALPLTGVAVWAAYVQRLPDLATMPTRYVTAYQTVVGLFGHLLVFDARWNPGPFMTLPLAAAVISGAIIVASLLLSLAVRPRGDDCRARAVHVAMMAALVVTISPFAEEYHYVLVLPSLAVAWWWALSTRLGAAWWAALAAATSALVLPLPYEHPMFNAGLMAVFAYPRVYGAYLLWGILLMAVRRS
jgi:hypothetical protein